MYRALSSRDCMRPALPPRCPAEVVQVAEAAAEAEAFARQPRQLLSCLATTVVMLHQQDPVAKMLEAEMQRMAVFDHFTAAAAY